MPEILTSDISEASQMQPQVAERRAADPKAAGGEQQQETTGQGQGQGTDQPGQMASGEVSSTDELIQSILDGNPNGLTVVIYGPTSNKMDGGYSNTNNNREFTLQAEGMAEIHNTVGTKGGALELGVAIPAVTRQGIEQSIVDVHERVNQRYKSTKGENSPEEPDQLKVKNLSLFYHGGQDALYLPHHDSSFRNHHMQSFVQNVGYTLRDDVFVQLYACSAAGGENSFAETMSNELGGESNVFGHTSAAHTTENHQARVFGTMGDGTQMMDVMFPPAFVDSEVTRIWGENLPEGKQAEAREAVYNQLRRYYGRVFGLTKGWNDEEKEGFGDQAKVQESGYYASRGHRAPGREMFLDPNTSAETAQERWAAFAGENLSSTFGNIASVSSEFSSGALDQTVRPATGEAAQSRDSERPANTSSGGGGSVNFNVTAAVNYNKQRPYTKTQWEQVQRAVGAEVDGAPGPETAGKVAAWQQSNGLTADGKVGPATMRKINEGGGQQDAVDPQQDTGGGGGTDTGETGDTPNTDGPVPEGNVTANFSWSEFACNDRNNTPVPNNMRSRIEDLCAQLEILREEIGGKSISVNSGYRTPAYNRAVGGASRSQHVECRASDIRVSGMSPRQVANKVTQLVREGKMKQGGIGRYNSFTHYDIRGSAARWGSN